MDNSTKRRCFITIATGDKLYYSLAVKLLHSYRLHNSDDTPFGIIADTENEFTKEFDFTIVIDEPDGSYMDKLRMHEYTDFEETIFIDADSLVIKDLTPMWDDFSGGDDVSCYGRVLPPNSERGWFKCENAGKYKDLVSYSLAIHGGAYYLRRTERTKEIFNRAIEISKEYSKYKFTGFQKPADEPVLALSMASFGARPCPNDTHLAFVHGLYGRIKVTNKGEVRIGGKPSDAFVCHFSTKNTQGYMYNYLSALFENAYRAKTGATPDKVSPIKVRSKTLSFDIKTFCRYALKQLVKTILPRQMTANLKKRFSK